MLRTTGSIAYGRLPGEDAPRRRDSVESLISLLRGRRFVVLTGAGCSTDSGIPDYRGPTGAARQRQPMQLQEFLRSDAHRRRYWARSTVGWRVIAAAQPNPVHDVVAALEGAGHITAVITQNVDGLHRVAGSQRLIELHGSLFRVRCMACDWRGDRAALQDDLLRHNPGLRDALASHAPDGDADLDDALSGAGQAQPWMPVCPLCGGIVKPDVVFFGENVARPIVDAAWRAFEGASALLILGSSLAVYSGFRFARGAAERGMPIAIVNQGATRADDLAAVRVEESLAPTLAALQRALCGG